MSENVAAYARLREIVLAWDSIPENIKTAIEAIVVSQQ